MPDAAFPRLADNWEPTRHTLHSYAKAIGTLPQAHVIKHPAWWHISLKLAPDGLRTENMMLPSGGLINARLDIRRGEVVMQASDGWERTFDMREGRTGTEMAEAVISAASEHGFEADYVRKDFEDDDAGEFDEAAVAPFWRALTSAGSAFETCRSRLHHRSVGPVQFWPHGFDLAFEFFGTKEVEYEGGTHNAQLNLGFYSSGEEPYFYSNPYPFDPAVMGTPLEHGEWTTDGFEGSRLRYDDVVDRPDGVDIVEAYALEVYDAAAPSLMA